MKHISLDQKIFHTLRLGVAMCFIGHGAFGIITKQIWCNYFGVFGIGHDIAFQLMPLVGAIDILLGLTMLVFSMRAIAFWLVIWGVLTALLRPLSGEPFAEFIERAGNFGVPLALLIISNPAEKKIKNWFTLKPKESLSQQSYQQLNLLLRGIVFLLFIGHGFLNIIGKKGLINQYSSIGFPNPYLTAQIVGTLELFGAFMILIKPNRWLILILLIWKITSELFYPHYEMFEFIERGGSYCSIIALYFVLNLKEYFGSSNINAINYNWRKIMKREPQV